MVKFIWWLLWGGCRHDWGIHETRFVRDPDTGDTWKRYILQCKKCGDIKVRNSQ